MHLQAPSPTQTRSRLDHRIPQRRTHLDHPRRTPLPPPTPTHRRTNTTTTTAPTNQSRRTTTILNTRRYVGLGGQAEPVSGRSGLAAVALTVLPKEGPPSPP